MEIQLIEGKFSTQDSLELITGLIHIKIKFHENKITKESSEEDITYRESKIKKLQEILFELRSNHKPNGSKLSIDAVITVN